MNKLAKNKSLFVIPFITKHNTSLFNSKRFQVSSSEKLDSLQGILRLHSSVVPVVLVWVLLCCEYVSSVSLHYLVKPHISFPFCATSLLNGKELPPFASCIRASVDDVSIAQLNQ
ncbi:MAG TPA: hypothetical protein DCP31_00960 [Cyanobacteria bacterium UBA8543]|nr:hypothetical protein [Cyanobacteria bacterium UBA8543]